MLKRPGFEIMPRIFLLLLILCFFPTTAFALDDPRISWEEMESEHFIIHYPSSKEFFARRALSIAEEAHKKLVPALKWESTVKTHISVTDLTDEANGWARSVPRNEIRLQSYPPEITEELGFYDDWMRQLIYHEYTHILHTDTSSGLHPVLNAIFGKFARNNATAPRWYTEGLAVYYETRMSNSGRLRNSLYKTMLFNAAIQRVIPPLGDMSAGRISWPSESAHYLFGAFFIQYIAEHYGSHTLTQWNHEYGNDWIPYAMNRAALRIWHKTWDELYEEWRQTAYKEAEIKLSEFKDLTAHSSLIPPWRHTRPIIHQQTLTYLRNDGYHPKSIVQKDLTTGKETALAECWGRCEHHWNKTGKTLYFTHAPVHDGYQQFESLYALDTTTQTIRHLELPGRIRSFALDGDDLYRVIQVNESNQIWRTSLVTHEDACLYTGKPFEQIEDITVKDKIIAASVFSPEKQQFDIQIFTQNTWTSITDDKATENSLFWMHDGQLGYVSDRTGELNLWRWHPSTGTHERLTNLVDGILHPSESENGDIYYTQYTTQGTTIAQIQSSDLHPQAPQEEPSFTLSLEYPELAQTSQYKPHRYKPWQWLWPQYWQPRFSWSDSTRASIGIALNSSDFVDHHALSFYFDYITGKDAVDFSIKYSWMSLLWDITLDAGLYQASALYRDNQQNKTYDYQTFFGDISATRIMNGRVWSQSVTLSAHAEFSEAHDPLSWSKRDPSARPVWLPTMGWHNALIAQYSWSNLHQQELAVVANDGYTVQTSLRFEAPWLGAQNYAIIARASASASWIMPWMNSHIFNLKLSGGTSWTENKSNVPFSLSSSRGFNLVFEDVQMHGYPSGLIYGRHFLYGHAAYTAPLWNAEVGHSTLPIGFTRLSLSGFGDWGYAWVDDWNISHSKFSIGAKVLLDFHLGYRLPVRVTLGYAWGGAPYGGHDIFLLWSL